jgi:WD40 repeat protein
VHTLTGHSDWVFEVVFSPNGNRVASASGSPDPLVKIWNTATGALVSSLVGVRLGWRVEF